MNRSPTDTPSESAQPQDEFQYDAFISYSHTDSAWVHNVLLPRLEGEGLRACIDTRDFDIGVPSLDNMENAVERSRKTLLVLTPNWVASEWTAFEALLIQTEDPAGRGRRILPLMVEPCQDQLPKRLKMFTYLDLTDPAQLDFQMRRLLDSIRDAPSQPQPPPAEATRAAKPASRLEDLPGSLDLPGRSGRLSGDFNLERGLAALGQLLAHTGADTRLSLSVLESRLLDNLKDERLYGSNETIRSERARIVGELNRLALDRVGQSYNDLCKAGVQNLPESSVPPARTPVSGRSGPTLVEVGATTGHTPSQEIPPNPFGDTGRINDPDRFFDREDLLRQIFEELGKGVNLSLVGESQVGKSSLLSMVCALGPERLSLPPEAFAYLSLEWVDDEDDFYEALCDALGIEICRGFKLTRALRDKRIVLCLDEIEKMAWEGFSVRLRSQLRGLADGPAAPLKLVIASRSPLAHLFPDSPELDSPLAGICRQLDVAPFSPEAARTFVADRLRDTGVTFSRDEIATAIHESGGHPARLQQILRELYDQRAST
jgi:hypothetical protein